MKVKSRKKYTQEFKDQVVALAELGKSPSEVAEDMEISKDLIYAWRRKAAQLPQRGSGPGWRTRRGSRRRPSRNDELRELRERLADLQLENDILKKPPSFWAPTPIQNRKMIQSIKEYTGASIRKICTALNYPLSSYHSAAKLAPTQLKDQEIGDQIETIFHRHRRRYGYRRIVDDLRDLDIVCSAARVRRLMKQRGLVTIQPKNFVPKTSDGKANKPSPNLLADQDLPDGPNQVWAGDITFGSVKICL